MSEPRRTARDGFALLELVIGMAIASLLLLLAAQLLHEVSLAFLDTTRESWEPQPRLAAVFLRRDVRAASGVVAGPPFYTTAPLVLGEAVASLVRYEVEGKTLWRVVSDAGGMEIGRRAVLEPIESWRWRQPAAGLVEIEYVVAENNTRSLLAGGRERLQASTRPRTTHLLVAQRLGRSGW